MNALQVNGPNDEPCEDFSAERSERIVQKALDRILADTSAGVDLAPDEFSVERSERNVQRALARISAKASPSPVPVKPSRRWTGYKPVAIAAAALIIISTMLWSLTGRTLRANEVIASVLRAGRSVEQAASEVLPYGPYAIDPKGTNPVVLTVPYKQIRNPNSVTYMKQDKPLSLKITYNGVWFAPKYIQVKITYKIQGLDGSYTLDGVYGLKDGAYTLDRGLDAFLTELIAEESELLPKDFGPIRPLTVTVSAVTVIPTDVKIDPVTGKPASVATGVPQGLATSRKPASVATGVPQGLATSNKLSLILKQVLVSESAK